VEMIGSASAMRPRKKQTTNVAQFERRAQAKAKIQAALSSR
jgi:hypothetical protein